MENTCKAPGLVFKRLDILDFDEQDVTRLSFLDLERTGEVVHLCQVHILDVVSAVIVLDLASGPIEAFDLDGLAVLDSAAGGYCSTKVRKRCTAATTAYHRDAICSVRL